MITSASGNGNMRITFAGSGLTTAFRDSIQVYYRGLKLAERSGGIGHYDIEWSGTAESSWITSIFIRETPDLYFHDINLGASNAYVEIVNINAT